MQVKTTNNNPSFEIKSGLLQITLNDNRLAINRDGTKILHKPIDEIKNSKEPEDLRLKRLLAMIDKTIRAAQKIETPHIELKEFLEKEGEPIQLLDALINQMSTAEGREDLIPDKSTKEVNHLRQQISSIDSYYGTSIVKKLESGQLKPDQFTIESDLTYSVSKALKKNNLKELFAGLQENQKSTNVGLINLVQVSINNGKMSPEDIAKLTAISKKIEQLKELLEKRFEEE